MPLLTIGPFDRPAVVIACHPFLFQLKNEQLNAQSSLFLSIPYRMIYAIGTQDSIFLYDTRSGTPFLLVKDLHYATITDMGW